MPLCNNREAEEMAASLHEVRQTILPQCIEYLFQPRQSGPHITDQMIRLPKRTYYPRLRWQPLKSSRVETTPRHEVSSVVVNPKDSLGLEENDDHDLLDPVDIQIG